MRRSTWPTDALAAEANPVRASGPRSGVAAGPLCGLGLPPETAVAAISAGFAG